MVKFTLYKVCYRARGLSTGYILQDAVVSALSAEHARDLVGDMLARQYRVGAWFVDWSVLSAALVG